VLRAKLFLLVCIGCISYKIFAQSNSETTAQAEAPAAVEPAEWIDLQSQIQTLKAKVNAKEKLVEELLKEKNSTKDPKRSVEIFNEIKKEHKELLQTAVDYEQKRNYLKYRFPEKGSLTKHKYKRIDVRSIEELETSHSLDGRLKSVQEKLRKQYNIKPPTKAEETKKEKEKLAPSVTEPTSVTK
jgi:hypothetical protein